METLSLGKLTFDSFLPYVTVQESSVSDYPWTIVDHISLTESEELQLNFITQRLQQEPTHLLNEATIWGRAIYPMLLLVMVQSLDPVAVVRSFRARLPS
ncbi:MAG: hypothetical protein HC860_27025 [Alkalinema sp. RU_4_3]|nr:hypothetical protein [Alkalinema sp. RU_4_3]